MTPFNSIVSWNISHVNGLLGPKTDDTDFTGIIQKHDIICLQETGHEVHLPNYRSFSDLRPSTNSGGVTTLVKENLCSSFNVVNLNIPKNRSMNIVVIKFSSKNINRDIYLLNVYIPPSNSRRKHQTTNSEENFDILQDVFNMLTMDGEVIICGDINARIGSISDLDANHYSRSFVGFPSHNDNVLNIPHNSPVCVKRNSQDIGTNSHKNLLLDLVQSNNLVILNGRTIGDSVGRYTCFKWNGNSVVDYFICSGDIIPSIKSLQVLQHTLYSDHNPVVLSFWGNITTTVNSSINNCSNKNNYKDAPSRYKITRDNLDEFKSGLSEPSILLMVNEISRFADSCTSVEDIKNLNRKVTDLINNVASQHIDKSKNNSTTANNKKNPWFDRDCRVAKRDLNKSARILDKHPNSDSIKTRHRNNVKSYRKLVKNKKDRFFSNLNFKIKNGKIISWKDLKKLKRFTKSEVKPDNSHLDSFQTFFSDLYSDTHSSIDELTKSALFEEAVNINELSSDPNTILNDAFTLEELSVAISSLNIGKASSFDHISNELIKGLDDNFKQLLLKLFNLCLSKGCYFWSESIITPLHKKGAVSDPDNYRAIAVCSCIGKLLSVMLLNRLTAHRSSNFPDPPNQCGFTKGSQCNDHLFTLHTILEKYKRVKSKVYAVFIDLRKAFDLVCRQALLYKLACYGVDGGFFNILKSMYSNSTGYIKLDGKISAAFDILKGTEQGHPLSPELFKVYFKELSDLLNTAISNNPNLNGLSISHLAWADDLVILSLDIKSVQTQLDIVEEYCSKWGLEINMTKTKFMIFNARRNSLSHETPPTLEGKPLVRVYSYCYLGVIISSNGNFKDAQTSLSRKGLGASFALRRTIDIRFV